MAVLAGHETTFILPLSILAEKENYIGRSTNLIKKSSDKANAEELCTLTRNVEYLVKDRVCTMKQILEMDGAHNFTASLCPDTYAFEKTQKILEKLLHKVFKNSKQLLDLCDLMAKEGCQINKSEHEALRKLVNKYNIICTKSEEMYEGNKFKQLITQAEKQIQDGNAKAWP